MRSFLTFCFLSFATAAQAEQHAIHEDTPTDTIQVRICQLISDTSDRSASGVFSLEPGQEMQKVEMIIEHRRHDAIARTGQQKSLDYIETSEWLEQNLGSDYEQHLLEIGGEKFGSRVLLTARLLSSRSYAKADARSAVEWHCHAEGHKYSSRDGEITASLKIEYRDVPTTNDLSDVFLSLILNSSEMDEQAFEKFRQDVAALIES